MKRGGPLRRTGFKRKPPTGERPAREPMPARDPAKGIPVRSARKRREMNVRATLVKRLVVEGVQCEVCPELGRVAGIVIPGGCSGLGGIHERRKRSGTGSVDHAPNLIPACNTSNGWIETATGDMSARSLFGSWLVVRPGDPEWDECGRTDDPEPVTVKFCQRCGQAYVTVPPSGWLPCRHEAVAKAS